MTQKRLEDPRDLYVKSPEPLSIPDLAKQFKGKKGMSKGQLYRRCREENWVKRRKDYFDKVEQKAEVISVERAASKKAITLDELNEEAANRARMLLKINEQKLKDAVKEREVTGPDGTVYKEKFVNIAPKDLRTIQKNILELHAALRLYANFDPDKPVESKSDNSNDDSFLDTLFAPIFASLGTRKEETPDAGADPPPAS